MANAHGQKTGWPSQKGEDRFGASSVAIDSVESGIQLDSRADLDRLAASAVKFQQAPLDFAR